MRLQLIRYESVELTEQLMKERQEAQDGDPDSLAGVGELKGIVLDGGEVGAAGGGGPGTDVHSEGCVDGQADTVYYILSSGGNGALQQDPGLQGAPESREDSVMLQLQNTAQQLGLEVV